MASFMEFQIDDDPEPSMICFFSTLHYRLADGSTLSIEQEAVWCDQCRSFGIAETVPSVEELRERIRELQSPTRMHYFIYGNDDSIKGALDQLRVRLKWRNSRKSPARCLACGSTDIEPVRFGENRLCVVKGKRLVQTSQGFADTADWVAEFSSEGLAMPANGGAGEPGAATADEGR